MMELLTGMKGGNGMKRRVDSKTEQVFIAEEQRTECKAHYYRIVVHLFSTVLIVVAWLLTGEQVGLLFRTGMFSLPLIVAVDLWVLKINGEPLYRKWVKYLVSTIDIIYLVSAILSIHLILGREYFPLHIHVPAFTGFFFLLVLSGFRFNKKVILYNIGVLLCLLVAMMYYDVVVAGRQDVIWYFSYLTVGLILSATSVIVVFIGNRARYMVKENYRRLMEKQYITAVFGRYVSEEVAREVLDGRLELGGEEREISILFCDIRNFTALSEKLTAKEVVAMLNRFFRYMAEPVSEQEGVIDKMIGDALMALFGAPVYFEDHASRAVRAATAMLEKLEQLNNEFARDGMAQLEIGIGIATGPVVIGNIGTETRMDYTAIGDTVNVASRIEGLCRQYGKNLLVDSATSAAAGAQFDFEKLGTVQVKGKSSAVPIYALK